MAAHFPPLAAGPEEITLKFRFQIDGTSDPDLFVGIAGMVDSIVYSATGVYTITLASAYRYPTLVTAFAKVDSTGLTDDVRFTSYDFDTGVVVLQGILQDGSQAAAVVTDDSWVHVELTFCRRSNLCPTLDI